MKPFIYLVQARTPMPWFEELVSEHSDCIVLFWSSPPLDRRVFDAEHPGWSGEIHLFPDGRMERPGIDRGTALLDADQLVLNWDRWPTERLARDDRSGKFVSADGRFQVRERLFKGSRTTDQVGWTSFDFPGSTWNTGRNRLLVESLQRSPYNYYIFLDDDLRLTVAADGDPTTPFRRFERFLLDVRPAVGYCSGSWHSRAGSPACCSALHAFDATINAFQWATLPVLLPYYEGFDVLSWWWSQEVLFRVSSMVYPGATVQNNRIEYENTQHADYPRMTLKELCYPHEFVRQSLRAEHRCDFERFAHPGNRSVEFPLAAEGDYRRERRQIAELFDLSHIYWRDKAAYWQAVRGDWLDT